MIAVLTPTREARLRAGLSQQELADLVGVARQTISYIDRGTIPARDLRDALSEVLNKSASELWPADRSAVAA